MGGVVYVAFFFLVLKILWLYTILSFEERIKQKIYSDTNGCSQQCWGIAVVGC